MEWGVLSPAGATVDGSDGDGVRANQNARPSRRGHASDVTPWDMAIVA